MHARFGFCPPRLESLFPQSCGSPIIKSHWSASLLSGVLGTGLPGLGTEHLPGALCSGTGSPALGLLRKGTPLASRVARGVSGPSSSCVWNPRVFADDARECPCPFVLCIQPQGCLRRGVRGFLPESVSLLRQLMDNCFLGLNLLSPAHHSYQFAGPWATHE